MNSALPDHSSSNTLRPRNRRNVPEDDQPAQASFRQIVPAASSASSASRSLSPVLRSCSPQNAGSRNGSTKPRSKDESISGAHGASQSIFLGGLWGSSLTTIRGIASDLIGTSASRSSSPSNVVRGNREIPRFTTSGDTSGSKQAWGPPALAHQALGSGTHERQRAELEAKKRERLLIAHAHIQSDGQGRHKRRGSSERVHASMPPSVTDEREALIYIHKVMQGDTMAGVMIKYNCEAQSFRKANRLWPNDSIQSRKLVVLPIESCGVKGRKLSDSEVATVQETEGYFTDRLGDAEFLSTNPIRVPSLQGSAQEIFGTPVSPSPSGSLSLTDESSYLHDSWVQIDGFPAPTEVARLSRRALGYFPRARRKSQTFSDMDTPSHSLDITRSSFQSDTFSRSSPNSNVHFGDLRGSGGVGSMDRNVRSPGPANDGLNKLFPGMERRVALSNASTSDGAPVHSLGIENIGGSIESWVRKMANKASSSLQAPNAVSRPNGDLIELSEEAFESARIRENETPDARGRSRLNVDSRIPRAEESLPPNGLRSRPKVFDSTHKRRD